MSVSTHSTPTGMPPPAVLMVTSAPERSPRFLRQWSAVLCATLLLCCACTPPGLVLGRVLSDLTSEVQGVLDSASASGNALVLQAGAQVRMAIDNSISAFADELETGINRVDEATKQTVNQLDGLVDDLVSQQREVVRDTTDSAQQLVNSLPFTDRRPQVRDYEPLAVAAIPAEASVAVTIRGNFVSARTPELQPTLEIDGTVLTPATALTSELVFEVPGPRLASAGSAVSSVVATLTVPYEDGHIFKDVVPGVFQLRITQLPASPVRSLTLLTTTLSSSVERRPAVWPADGSWEEVSSEKTGRPHRDSHQIASQPGGELGWSIDTTTVSLETDPSGTGGRVKTYFRPLTPLEVALQVETDPCRAGFLCKIGSGRIRFRIHYEFVRTLDTSSQTAQSLQIGWSDVLTLPVTQNDWSVVADLYDGTTLTIGPPGLGNHHVLQVADNGTTIRISAASAATALAW